MGFYYRKSVNLGPFRVNLSKSGLGYSVGGRGFCIGILPRTYFDFRARPRQLSSQIPFYLLHARHAHFRKKPPFLLDFQKLACQGLLIETPLPNTSIGSILLSSSINFL